MSADVILKMVLAGVLFGCWPLLINRSGMDSNSSSILFSAVGTAIVVSVALTQSTDFAAGDWRWALAAGVAGGLGVLVFNSGLAEASTAKVSILFVIMILVQIMVPAIYHVYVNQTISPGLAAAFAATCVSAILFTIYTPRV
jgi:hypothetical protein